MAQEEGDHHRLCRTTIFSALYNSIKIYIRHCLLLDDDIFLFLHIIRIDGKLLTCALEHVQGLCDDAKQTEGEPAENNHYLSNS